MLFVGCFDWCGGECGCDWVVVGGGVVDCVLVVCV